jgi:hypothetical protein
MAPLLAVLCALAPPDDLPSIADLEWQARPEERREEMPLGIEVFALRTQFDDGLKIENHAGAGFDLELGWDYGKTRLNLCLGFAAWRTENDDSVIAKDNVRVLQYRLGAITSFTFRFIELGVGATAGVYRFSRDNENDTSPFLEFEGSIGARLMPELKIGILGLATHTESSFNRTHTHLFHNYSAGGFIELTF